MNAVDTNIFLYSMDRGEPAKQLKAQQLLLQLRAAPQPTFLLWQVLGELGCQLRRWRDQGKITPTEFGQHIQAFRYLFPLVLPTPAVFGLTAAQLAGAPGLIPRQSPRMGCPVVDPPPLPHRPDPLAATAMSSYAS